MERSFQSCQRLTLPLCYDLDRSVRKVAHESAEPFQARSVVNKESEANILHTTRDQKPPCLLHASSCRAHGTFRPVTRQPIILDAVWRPLQHARPINTRMADDRTLLWQRRRGSIVMSCVMVSCCDGAELQLWRDNDLVLRELYPDKASLHERAQELEVQDR